MGNVLLLLSTRSQNIDSALMSGGGFVSGCGVNNFNYRKLISSQFL